MLILVCALGLLAHCTAPASRKVTVHVRGRPDGHACPAARIVSSSEGWILDDVRADAAGDATLRIPRTSEYELTSYHDFGRVSLMHLAGNDDVVIPTWCTSIEKPRAATLQLSIAAQDPLSELFVNSPDRSYLREASVTGTSFTLSLETYEAFYRGDLQSYSLFARGSHPDGSSEIGAIFDLAVDATSAAVDLHPVAPSTIAVSVTGGPTSSRAYVLVYPTRALDVLVISDELPHPFSPSPDWTSDVPVYGLEYATGTLSRARFQDPSGAFRLVEVSSSGLGPVTIDASILPPLMTLRPRFADGVLRWIIENPGPSNLGVAVIVSADYDEYYFPSTFCDSGSCRLELPPRPADLVAKSDPPVSMGIWYLDSTNAPPDYPGNMLGILTREGAPGIRRASGSPLVLSY